MIEKSQLKYKNWMVTILSNKEGSLPLPSVTLLKETFDKLCDRYVFQEEEHENAEIKHTHYQCCIVYPIRIRKHTLLGNLSAALSHPAERIRLDKIDGTWEQAVKYCSKNDTKIGETYSSEGVIAEYDQSDIEFLNKPENRYPWQTELLSKIFEEAPTVFNTPDDREIYWISDSKGNSGKSKMVKWICSSNPSCSKISFGTANQLRSGLISIGPQICFFIDTPRTLGEDDSINDVLSVVEDLKNGFLTSSFYGTYTKLLMKPPHVVIFSNIKCPSAKMSGDRWRSYSITEDKELLYTFENQDYIEKGYSMHNEGVRLQDCEITTFRKKYEAVFDDTV